MGKLIDITGQKFGPITVLEYVGQGAFRCHCSLCDNERNIWGHDLRKGRYKTCGCGRKSKVDKVRGADTIVPKVKKSDDAETPAERKARKRAELAKKKEKKAEPTKKKEKKADKSKPAGERHEPQLVIKNGKTYPKSSKVVLFKGDLRYLAELCEETGMKSAKVRDRLSSGWTVEQALDLVERKK